MRTGERRPRWRVGLAVQLDVLVVAVVLAMGTLIGTFFVRSEAESMEAALTGRIRVLGGYLASAAEASWADETPAALDALLSRTVLDPDVAYVLLKTTQGEIRAARWGEETTGAVVERQFPIQAPAAGAAAAPVEPFGAVHPPGRAPVGVVAIGVDLSSLAAQRRDLIGRTVAALVFAAGLAAALGHGLVTLLMRGTVSRLLAGIRAIGAGDLGFRMRLDVRTAELSEAARAFDEMADRLSGTLVTKAALEEQVAARTEQLRSALDHELQAREALEEREERLRLLLDSTAEAIYGLDLEARCTFANPATARLLGFDSPEAIVGQDLHALVHHARADGTPFPKAECPVVAAVRAGRPYHSPEVTYWRADGTSFRVETWCHPVLHRGRVVGAVLTFLDVTERRQMEDELLNIKKLESLGVLAGGIAHDFNNLLTGILGNLSVARERLAPGGETQEILEEAEHAAKRARALTQQLLTFSKGGAPVKKVLSIRALVADAATFGLRGTPVRAELSCGARLWSVEADPGQLAQVVQNLVINAAQAMPAGGRVAVSCDNAQLGDDCGQPLPPGHYVRITVRDEGSGIAPEHLGRIFDPYFTTKRAGNGLGLATVYAIVKKHGGHVAVSSRIGAGTTFEIWLPATGRVADEGDAAPSVTLRGHGRVLVMDDEELVRSAAAGMLQALGYEPVCVADGREALRLYDAQRRGGRPFAAVLLDLTVPGGMGGVEALERLLSVDREVRAVATSGYSNDPVMADHAQFGFVGVLPKPYTLEDLARVLSEAIPPAPPPAAQDAAARRAPAVQG